MIKQIRPWLKLVVFVFVLIAYLLRLIVGSYIKGKSLKRGFRIRRKFCQAALRTFNLRVQYLGTPKKQGPCLYISNHRSMLDPLVELRILDAFILSKAEVNDYPLLGKGARETGVFFVDRDSDNSRKAALQSIEKLFLSGSHVLIYPEGTTQDGNLTSDFRKGAFDVAFNHNIPVIPVMIEYPDPSYYWTDGSLMDYFKRIFSKPGHHKVTLQIGEEITASDKEGLVQKTKEAIDRMILDARNHS